ncbi:hypothetical protein N9H44_02400 [Saprospiraceae bacterium]|mgnify:FL=1|nr:hypothetical protein [Saprospiraceae bacterium]
MVKSINSVLLLGAVCTFVSCTVFKLSMLPSEVYNTLPNFTKSKMISYQKAEEEIEAHRCKYLVKGRDYSANMGLTVKDDLKNGAKGIDDWVDLDGGNTYVLLTYRWEVLGDNVGTQLHLKFDTMLCE